MGHAYQSPLRRWDVLVGLCQSINAKTFVEIGCKEGRTTGALLAALPDLKVCAVDPWAAVPNDAEDYTQWDFAAIEREFWENVGAHKNRCVMLRATSEQAAKGQCMAGLSHFMPEDIDVVFIDAAHDYQSCREDIRLWWPLVRAGGFLCGHDYQHAFPGVMRAVADSFPLLQVAVCPDSVWIVSKNEAATLREAA